APLCDRGERCRGSGGRRRHPGLPRWAATTLVGMKPKSFDRSLEIEQAQLRGFARSISEVEWLLLILVVLYLFVTRPDLAQELPVIGALVAFAAFVLAFRYGRLLVGLPRLKIAVEILAMLAFLTAILGLSGG